MRTIALVAAACACLTSAAIAQQDEIGLAIGSRPATAQVQTLDGQNADLSAYIGRRPVIIQFWAHWCQLCESLMDDLATAQRRYGRDVEFILIGVGVNQTRERMRRHFEREPVPFRLFYDATGAAVRAFEAPGTSYVVALDASGRVRYTGIGEEQDLDLAARRALGRP